MPFVNLNDTQSCGSEKTQPSKLSSFQMGINRGLKRLHEHDRHADEDEENALEVPSSRMFRLDVKPLLIDGHRIKPESHRQDENHLNNRENNNNNVVNDREDPNSQGKANDVASSADMEADDDDDYDSQQALDYVPILEKILNEKKIALYCLPEVAEFIDNIQKNLHEQQQQ